FEDARAKSSDVSVSIGIANLSPDSGERSVCFREGFGSWTRWRATDDNTVEKGVRGVDRFSDLRLKAVNGTSCNSSGVGGREWNVGRPSAGDAFIIAVFDSGSNRDSARIDNRGIGTLSSSRFYVRFFHGGDTLGTLTGRTGDCTSSDAPPDEGSPFGGGAIFDPVFYGRLARSTNVVGTLPNTVFSAAVSTGQPGFTTPIRACSGTTEIDAIGSVTFRAGVLTDIFLTGNGSGSDPHELFVCEDNDAFCESPSN
ncbi:MAG: hypothetical protein AAF219_11445, partial [Myxococcota bacterium]